jgi:hypothetical protein
MTIECKKQKNTRIRRALIAPCLCLLVMTVVIIDLPLDVKMDRLFKQE